MLLGLVLAASLVSAAAVVRGQRELALACLMVGAGAGSFALAYALRLLRGVRDAERQAAELLALVGGESQDRGTDPVARLGRTLAMLAEPVGAVHHRLAHRHRLTGLPTRERLLAIIRDDLAAGKGGMLALYEFGDDDRLSAFEPAVADETLAILAQRLKRMVGDERGMAHVDRARFAVWLSGRSPARTQAVLDAIGYALGDALTVGERRILPEIHVGTAAAPADGDTAEAVLACAISALAGARRGGGPALPTSTGTAVERARDGFDLEQDLRQAIVRNQFALVYQPLVDARQGRVVGAEALLRWNHPDRGIVSPSLFVPVAEAAGLAEEIGLWVLNAACRQLAQWIGEGLGALTVAVNLSAHQLQRDDLGMLIARTMGRHGLPAGVLEVELTETVAAGDVERTRALLDGLRRQGIRIAIDDFGTGYSSLSYLRQLSFDKLKIDREFVTDVHRQPSSQAICQSIIALGRGLGIRVLAEGVEQAEELAWLRRHGCMLFQGFYFERGLAPEQFAAFVADGDRLARLLGATPAALQQRIRQGIRG